MIGPKKLSTIRQEIEQALEATGEDVLQRLERQLVAAKRKGSGTEVLEGLQQFLATSRQRNGGKRRAAATK